MTAGTIVECVDTDSQFNLTKGKTYVVVPNRDIQLSDSIFIVNDKGENVRYLKKRFQVSPLNFVKTHGSKVTFTLQDGPIKEVGVNGCQIDAVLTWVRDKVKSFQDAVPCHENEKALDHIEEALFWFEKRRRDRETRKVEGTSAT